MNLVQNEFDELAIILQKLDSTIIQAQHSEDMDNRKTMIDRCNNLVSQANNSIEIIEIETREMDAGDRTSVRQVCIFNIYFWNLMFTRISNNLKKMLKIKRDVLKTSSRNIQWIATSVKNISTPTTS